MNIRSLFILSAASLLSLAGTFAQDSDKRSSQVSPTDETAIRTIVTQHFELYKKKDSAAISALWNDKSQYLAAHKRELDRIFAEAAAIEVNSLAFKSVTADGDNVKVSLTIGWNATELKIGKPYKLFGSNNRVIVLKKDGNNWQIVRHISAENDLAIALIKIKSEDERRQALNGNELFNVNLAKAVREEGDRLEGKISPDELIEIYRFGLSIAEQFPDTDEVIKTLNRLGLAIAVTDKHKALDVYAWAIRLAEETNNKDMAARVYGNVGVLYFDQGDVAKSLENAQKSVTIAVEIGNKQVQANSLGLIGNLYNLQGDYQRSLEYQLKALSVREEMKDDRGVAFSLNNIGLIQILQGNYSEAIDLFERSINLVHRSGAVQLYNLGIAYKLKGDYARAMSAYRESIALCEKRGSEECIAGVAMNIGDLYNAQGDYDQAAKYLNRSLDSSRKAGDKRGQASALGSISQTYHLLGQYQKALENRQLALSLFKEMDYKSEIANSLDAIGNIYFSLGDLDRANDSFHEGLKLSESLGEDEKISSALVSIAAVQLAKGDLDGALKTGELARSHYQKLVGLPDNWKLYSTLGRIYQALGRNEEALQNFEKAISAIEDLRANLVGSEEAQQGFLTDKDAVYSSLVRLLLTKKDDARALSFAERRRSRTLLDVLQNGRIEIAKALSPVEREQEQRLKNELTSLNAQISKENARSLPDKARLADLQKRLKEQRLEFEDLRTRLYSAHPELKVSRGEMRPVTLDEISSQVHDQQAAVAEFLVDDDKTFLFLVSRNSASKAKLEVFTIDAGRKQLADKVTAYRDKVAAGDLDIQPHAQELYELLFKPAAAQLAGKTNLIIVPDGPLWDLSFQALQDQKGKYLTERAAISYAPSLTALREMARKGKGGEPGAGAQLLAFGNPIVGKETSDRVRQVFMSEKLEPLLESERLVNGLGKMYGTDKSKVFVGNAASEAIAKTEVPKYRIIQFATHGILIDASPMYSHLVLARNEKDASEDGLLEAWEMKDLDLKADMVILSACDTARGRISNGEGVIGMSWALFIAGTPTTVASLWQVESSSTTELMLEFHRQLLAVKGISKAEALRRAQLKLLRIKKFNHPSYWAAFVMIGDGS